MLTVDFELDGQPYTAINGGPEFTFDEAVSLLINCDGQAEVDYYWDKLTRGRRRGDRSAVGSRTATGSRGRSSRSQAGELLDDRDPGVATRAMQAMFDDEEDRPRRDARAADAPMRD